tara:strand:+ start:26277 stop:26630 length:354 start_codon:yes stop_codon:yes gene_type:complete
MLKAKTITLLDGGTMDDVEILPGLGAYYILKDDGSIREVPKERVAHIDYVDKKTVEVVKGLALVPIIDDLDTLDELYEDYDSLNALMAEVTAEDDSAKVESGEPISPLSKNPYEADA